ncbi:MAG: phenylalanine--tRNA ligase subunit beta [Alphaproteobacteria bacterium]|nr:phenylalanine--tRNA ligase subunit beta [Alphaproteobacteria bacterium]
MKILWSWLNDHLSVTHSIDEVMSALTHSGTETEMVPVYSWSSGFQVGQVLSVSPHPNAEHLQVCTVDLGHGTVASIVCGARNVRAQLKTIVALPGCLLPGSTTPLATCVLRGVSSHGMLCSARELSMQDIWNDTDGLIELDQNTPVGKPLRDFLPQDDALLQLNVTPNRGDLFSHRGVARELVALGLGHKKTTLTDQFLCNPESFAITMLGPDFVQRTAMGCPFFQLCRMDQVDQQATPPLMKRRLVELSIKLHGPCVDLTNYMAEDTGQPMHVFDADAISGTIQVRNSTEGEVFDALDGERYSLPSGCTVIADAEGIVSLAGIMGGMRGRCQNTTRRVLLESACFDPASIARTGRLTRINSASRARFERGVDPALSMPVLAQSAQWLGQHTGAVHPALSRCGQLPDARFIPFHPRAVSARCGVTLSEHTIRSRLEHWGAQVHIHSERHDKHRNDEHRHWDEKSAETIPEIGGKPGDQSAPLPEITPEGSPWRVTPPSWRWDWQDSWDCVTETLRGQGYTEVPITPFGREPDSAPTVTHISKGLAPVDYTLARSMRSFWMSMGLYESVTWSFISATMAQPFFVGTEESWNQLHLCNPLSKELGVLRPSILPSLVSVAQHHQKYGLSFQPIFEIGPRFLGLSPESQDEHLAALWPIKKSESWVPQNPKAPKEWSFYDIKAMVDRCIAHLGITHTSWIRASQPWYHPGRSGQLVHQHDGKEVVLATIGQLHPRLNMPFFGAELYLNAWQRPEKSPAYGVKSLQPVGKDLSFYMAHDHWVGHTLDKVRSLDIPELDHILITDMFDDGKTAPQDGGGKTDHPESEAYTRSITIRCIFQPINGPFSSPQLHELMARVVQCAQKDGWILRGSLDDLVQLEP